VHPGADRGGDVEPARRAADLAIGHQAAKRPRHIAQIAFQRQDQQRGAQVGLAETRLADQRQLGDLGALEHALEHLRDAGPRLGREERGQRHPPHLHPHQVGQVHPRQTEARDRGRDPLEDEGVFQRPFDPARVHRRPRWHAPAVLQGFPVAAHLTDHLKPLVHEPRPPRLRCPSRFVNRGPECLPKS